MTDARILFENEEWTVLEAGLEHRRTGYFIPRDALAQRRSDGLWSWPVHLAEKSWCAMPAFMEAFACAAAVHGIPTDVALARSFRMARREVAAAPEQSAAARTAPGHLDDAIPDHDPALTGAERPGLPGERRRPAPTIRSASRRTRRAAPREAGRIRWAGLRLVGLIRAAWAAGRAAQGGGRR